MSRQPGIRVEGVVSMATRDKSGGCGLYGNQG